MRTCEKHGVEKVRKPNGRRPSGSVKHRWECRLCKNETHRARYGKGRPYGEATCEACGNTFERTHGGRRYCRTYECDRARANKARIEWAERNPEKGKRWLRDVHLRQKYGITIEQYEEMFSRQGGVCLICGAGPSDERWGCLAVDHCHETGRVRALLCMPCNTGMGSFRDDPERLREAAAYLESFRTTV